MKRNDKKKVLLIKAGWVFTSTRLQIKSKGKMKFVDSVKWSHPELKKRRLVLTLRVQFNLHHLYN